MSQLDDRRRYGGMVEERVRSNASIVRPHRSCAFEAAPPWCRWPMDVRRLSAERTMAERKRSMVRSLARREKSMPTERMACRMSCAKRAYEMFPCDESNPAKHAST